MTLGTNVIVLDILFAMKGNILRFHLPFLYVSLVSDENYRSSRTFLVPYAMNISEPVGDVFVTYARSDIEHDDSSPGLNTTKGKPGAW